MASLIALDHTGDTRHKFDNQDPAEVANAEQRFRELTGAGFTAAVRSGLGAPSTNGAEGRPLIRVWLTAHPDCVCRPA